MAGGYQAVDQGFFFGADLYIHGRVVVFQLRPRARTGDDRADMAIGQHPGGGEVRQLDAAFLAVLLQALRNEQRLVAKLRFHHALVATPRAAIPGRCLARLVFSGTPAATGGAVGHDTPQIVVARRRYPAVGTRSTTEDKRL